MTMDRRAALDLDFARRTCISLARPFHLSAEQFDPNYLLRASTVPNLKDSHTPAVHLEQEPHSQRRDSNGNSRDRMRSVRGASVVPRVDGGEAGHQPPHRFHVKEEEGDDDPTPPSAGSAPTSPPGQKAFIDTEVAGVAAVEDQFQVQMAVRDAAARRTRRGGLALRPPSSLTAPFHALAFAAATRRSCQTSTDRWIRAQPAIYNHLHPAFIVAEGAATGTGAAAGSAGRRLGLQSGSSSLSFHTNHR